MGSDKKALIVPTCAPPVGADPGHHDAAALATYSCPWPGHRLTS